MSSTATNMKEKNENNVYTAFIGFCAFNVLAFQLIKVIRVTLISSYSGVHSYSQGSLKPLGREKKLMAGLTKFKFKAGFDTQQNPLLHNRLAQKNMNF